MISFLNQEFFSEKHSFRVWNLSKSLFLNQKIIRLVYQLQKFFRIKLHFKHFKSNFQSFIKSIIFSYSDSFFSESSSFIEKKNQKNQKKKQFRKNKIQNHISAIESWTDFWLLKRSRFYFNCLKNIEVF